MMIEEEYGTVITVVLAVVVQFLSGIFLFEEVVGFTPFLLQLFALHHAVNDKTLSCHSWNWC